MESIQQPLLNSCENKKPSNSKDVEGGVLGVLTSLKFSIRFVLVAAILWMLLIVFLVLFSKVWSCQSSYIFFTGVCNKKSEETNFDDLIPSFGPGDISINRHFPYFGIGPDDVVIPKGRTPDQIVKNLSYDRVSDVLHPPSSFGGHFSWKQREESFKLNSSMKVQCGFMRNGVDDDMYQVDIEYVKKCKFVVVSAIFGQSVRSKKLFCFLMVVDEVSLNFMNKNNFVRHANDGEPWVGIWRLILLKHPPYDEPRRNENVAKMLTHRLFPQVQYSIWIDAQIRMTIDPLLLLQRYLWRGKNTFAIPEHECQKSIYDVAEYDKLRKHYAQVQPLIDIQMKVYYNEGLKPWS